MLMIAYSGNYPDPDDDVFDGADNDEMDGGVW